MELTYLPAPGHTLQAGFEYKQLHFNRGWIFSGSSASADTAFTYTDTSLWIEHNPVEQAA
ncbi:MAG: hypothetical protein IID15_01520 [Candidatus Marinimicrobia bacterium]|nr:hypothetical protein [Candidatus Neomarinimicrobiota bacterium]